MRFLISLCFVLSLGVNAHASVRRYSNDYTGFLADAGFASSIDFETLPDGSPSHSNVHITNIYNYDVQGTHFTPSNGTLLIAGNAATGYGLLAEATSPTQTDSIIADLIAPAHAVGAFFPGTTTLSAFDIAGNLLGTVSFSAGGSDHFVGIVSDIPIARATFGPSVGGESIQAFLFTPIPEPATLGLVLFGAFLLKKRRR